MRHEQVIENFVKEGSGGLGTYMRANPDLLYSRIPERYAPYGRASWQAPVRVQTPLAVRLHDGSILANGARMESPMDNHQWQMLGSLEKLAARFAVVPFHSIVAAWTDGKTREWERAPIPVPDLQQHVEVVVPSQGEEWKDVTERDKYGRKVTRQVHTLGDSVVRVKDRFYLSAVDETGVGAGMYFFAELVTDRPPASLGEALNALKPKIVQDAEAGGVHVRRQGEWFFMPTKLMTSQLLADVERGIAVYRQEHVLGRDGHHKLEEAVIYRAGEPKGEVYARGVMRHTGEEHENLDLGNIRWHRVVHNVQGASYTLSGRGTAQFD